MHRKFSLLRAVVVLAATLSFSAAFQAQNAVVKYSLDSPDSETITNDCNGEQVQMSGTMHFDYFFEQLADGGINYHVHSETHLKGVGLTSGAQYVGNDSTDYHTHTNGGQASDFSDTTKLKLVAQGPTPNMTMTTKVHVVVDAKGNVKVDRSTSTTKCSR